MQKVVMTFNAVDATGKPDGSSLDVEFAVDATATPKNSVTRFKLTSSASPQGAAPLEFRLVWNDAVELEQTINTILSSNPVP
jgi:hypothetical protein